MPHHQDNSYFFAFGVTELYHCRRYGRDNNSRTSCPNIEIIKQVLIATPLHREWNLCLLLHQEIAVPVALVIALEIEATTAEEVANLLRAIALHCGFSVATLQQFQHLR